LIEDVLPAKQICITGGPEKGQKSNLLVDAAISLAGGKPWLGHFNVPQACKVLYLTGETQGTGLQNIIHRVLLSRNIETKDLADRLLIKEALPALDDDKQLSTLRTIINTEGVQVVILDPLYFALGGVDAHVLTQVGATISKVGKMCIALGATPIFAHHMSKSAQLNRGQEREPMQLGDLNGAGFGPVAASWILTSYLAPYCTDDGSCALWLHLGGRAGHGGLYSVEIEEGPFLKHEPLYGRYWKISVQKGQEAKDIASRVKGAERQANKAAEADARAAQDALLMGKILQWLQEQGLTGAIQSQINVKFDLQPKTCKRLLQKMQETGLIALIERIEGDNPNSRRWRTVGAPNSQA
jgi:hypothetical protein